MIETIKEQIKAEIDRCKKLIPRLEAAIRELEAPDREIERQIRELGKQTPIEPEPPKPRPEPEPSAKPRKIKQTQQDHKTGDPEPLSRSQTFAAARELMKAAGPNKWFSVAEIHEELSKAHKVQSYINFQAFFAPTQTGKIEWLRRKREGVNVFFQAF